jgi:ATP-binding cassette subfamily B protein
MDPAARQACAGRQREEETVTEAEAEAIDPAQVEAEEANEEVSTDVSKAANAVRALAPYFRPYRRTLVPISFLLLVDAAFDAFWPLAFKFLIDNALIPQDSEVLALVLAALGIGVVVAATAQVGYDYLYARVCSGVLADLRLRMFDHLQQLSFGFYARTKVGDILSRFSGDLIAVENALLSLLTWLVRPALDIVLSMVLLFVLDWRLALGAMLVWPIALLGPRYFAPRALSSSFEKKRLESAALSVVQENVSGQPVVKAFGLEPLRRQGFQLRIADLRRSTARVAFVSSLVERSAVTGILILGIAIVGVGAWMTFQGLISIGTLVAFQSLFFTLGYSISYLTQYVPSLVQGLGGFGHIKEILDQEPQIVDIPAAQPLPRFSEEIALQDVTFAYPEAEEPSLHDFTARIHRGASVALVGASGSGKSTALSLLMRFYDPTTGSVAIDGCDLRGVTQASLRSQTAVVFQESFLFNTTIRENIRLGSPTATDEEVEAAARAAEIHDFIAAEPEGYDTVVGERGGRLSGGQRQRIAIARAIARDPAILLLDEATSALDPATEAALNATLARLGEGRTVITVTHRLASAKGAGRIFVLDRGELKESGSHEELLQAEGLYRRLWERQSGFTLSEEGDHAEVGVERLKHVPILSGLDDDLLTDLAERFASEQVPAERTVIQQGDPGDRFYLVARGRLAVTYRDPDGEDELVAVLQDGDHFGEIALLRKAPRVATVTTEVPSLLLSLAQKHFLDVLERAPNVRRSLEQIVEGRLAEIHVESWGRRPL